MEAASKKQQVPGSSFGGGDYEHQQPQQQLQQQPQQQLQQQPQHMLQQQQKGADPTSDWKSQYSGIKYYPRLHRSKPSTVV